MPRHPSPSDQPDISGLRQAISGFLDAEWYRSRYPDVAAAGVDSLDHFLTWGAAEGRDPNRWFDSRWYNEQYADVVGTRVPALVHYMVSGAAELRNPHPHFDAAWYADQHPEAALNPLLHHVLFGEARGWPTERPIEITDYLPSTAVPLICPAEVRADVIVPAYRGLDETRRCLESVLDDPDRPAGRVIVVDDCSPEAALSAWLGSLAAAGRITLLRNRRNLGFVASVNRGIEAAGTHDVVLLNSDTAVPHGWLRRLAAQTYAAPRIASVSPFSNNATICGYPCDEGGPLPLGLDFRTIDDACRSVNVGRSIGVPTTVGFCMYIRRAALDDVGNFDADAFGHGYGEENDFCLRATRHGWTHRLACDTFVYHEGAVSFGSGKDKRMAEAIEVLAGRYPQYARIVARHVNANEVAPFRFTVTAALFRHMGLPVLLMLTHQLGGGVRRHIDELVARLAGRANVLLLQASARGTDLRVPALRTAPLLTLPATRLDDLAEVLRSAAVSRVHVHHLMGLDLDARELIHRLGVPLDVTLHDYFAICPQVNLLPWPDDQYCGEPGPAACNTCIADRPSHGATDILSWRWRHAWLFLEADRVICPSQDARARLERHGLANRAIFVPHEPVAAGPWSLSPPSLRGRKLRIAVLGVLANQKGAQTIIAAAEAADPATIELHLIGYPEDPLPDPARDRIVVSGEYTEADLPGLLAQVKPHVVWFPAQWPETYSYTLSAAIEAGLPVVAARIGSFVERLTGRPLSWLVDPRASTREWLGTFDLVRKALAAPPPKGVPRPAVADFYTEHYLPAPATLSTKRAPKVSSGNAKCTVPDRPKETKADGLVDLRRPGRTSIVVIPELLENEQCSPCAYIRLLQPLDHPAIGAGFDIVLADAAAALQYRADIIATQRYAMPDLTAAVALAAHCRRIGATLTYDLDDDLLHIPGDHDDATALRHKAKLVRRLVRDAGAVFVSTPTLAASLASLRSNVTVVPNGLDERLWAAVPQGVRLGLRDHGGSVRVLCMGTATHSADFSLIEPALARLKDAFGDRVTIDMLGVSTRSDLPDWVNRPAMPASATGTYPGFVNWITQQPGWDIGLAPLADTAFNRCKSTIKTLDYAALGLAIVASDVPAYRGSLADGPGGMLAENRPEAWYATLSRLIRDREMRQGLARGAMQAFADHGTLMRQAEPRRATWLTLTTNTRREGRTTGDFLPKSRKKVMWQQ
jgi:GT2 family glycosyltransferase/glycosyltransferase involved in cell wall biosynthesis